MENVHHLVFTLALVMGASWCAGINLYATMAVLGLMHRFVPGFQLPENLAVLASWWVIAPAGVMYLVEFVADKVPAFDSAWDTIHTFIRIPAGAVLAASAVGDVPLELQVGAAIMGGMLALGAHATKATTRLVAHSTGTSPFVSPVASLVEDGLVIGTIGAVAAHPAITIGMVLLMIAAAGLLTWAFWGFAKKAYQALFVRKMQQSQQQGSPTTA